MYYFVSGSSDETPDDEVNTAEELAAKLLADTRNRESRRAASSVLKLCTNLKDCIAESYEQSEDGLTWTFHLKKGIMWVTSDGEEYDEVKAEDFVTGLRHGAEFNSETGWLLEGVIAGYTDYYEGEDYSDAAWEKVGIKAVDDYTLEFTLEAPAPYFPSMTCYAVLYPINKTFLEGKGAGCKLGEPDLESCEFGVVQPDSILYNGGFLLESNDLKSSTVLVKNEAYWDAENVHLNSVKRIYDDGSDPYSVIRGFEFHKSRPD